jgi:hypothetical protein
MGELIGILSCLTENKAQYIRKFNTIGCGDENKQKIIFRYSNFFLSGAEICGLLHPAQANLGYLGWFQSLNSPSTQSENLLL